MAKTFAFGFCFLLCVQSGFVFSNVNSKEKREFRSSKINIIWEKAQNKMSKNKLSKLKELLRTQDVEEMYLKKLKAHGRDEDGKETARIRSNLLDILNKFSLTRYAEIDNSAADALGTNSVRTQFQDSRLDTLWNIAKDTFSEDELSDLKTEFLHHKDKQLEYELLTDLLSKHDVSENSVLNRDKLAPEKLEKLRDQVLTKEEDVMNSFASLKDKVEKERKQKEDLPFTDPRVNTMWKKALKAGFTGKELESIKEELKHFDHKIAKHKHYQEQADQSRKMMQEGHAHLREKHEKFQQKADEHGRWVRKMHKTMLERITRDEL